MKYKLTWKNILQENLYRFVVIGFPVFLLATLALMLFIQFLSGELGMYSFSDYISGIGSTFLTLIVVYMCLLLFIFATSFSYWKNSIVGEHELQLDDDFFIWKSARQEVKTKLSLLRDFTVKRKSLIIKFDGIKKAKIEKNWILE